ncbi:MAG: TonB-dependent siderophore receptor, partial [Cyanobacteria bacterium P01_E01_bin.35]
FDNYFTGEFTTGSIQHQLVAGINLFENNTDAISFRSSISSLDVFEPEYSASPTGQETPVYDVTNKVQQLGFYLQDLISLTDNLKILLGGRFDIASQDFQNTVSAVNEYNQEEAFSPQAGIVYQPLEPISLYASYNRSFNLATSAFRAAAPEPERGEQFEIGIKTDFSDRLSATLALYDLTRSNLPTTDPNEPTQTIQVGEQRSQGIEFDVGGEILPGWNIVAGYAYTNAEITEDNTFEVGNSLNIVPENAFNIWTTYQIQEGNLQGLGFALGLFYFGERPGDLANTFTLPSYTRTDAAIFYERNNFRIAFNVENLFDVDYFVTATDRNRVFPGSPLTVVGNVSWQF